MTDLENRSQELIEHMFLATGAKLQIETAMDMHTSRNYKIVSRREEAQIRVTMMISDSRSLM